MAWTASIISKNFTNGFYNVVVRYTDGVRNIDETYKAQVPKATWIPDQVRSRISQLDIAGVFDVAVGPVTPSDLPITDTNMLLFGQRIKMLEVAKMLIDLGVLRADNPKVIALEEWIKNNFDIYIEKIDLWR